MTRNTALLAVVLIYAATFRLLVLNRPFEYDAEGAGCLNGLLARSYLRFDWKHHHGMPILSLDPSPATPIVFYPDHPPLLPLLIVPFYAVFGVGAWQTRLPIALLTLAMLFVLHRMLARAATERVALLATTVCAATPMVLYFGGFPDVVSTPLVLFVLLTVATYMSFHAAPRLKTLVPLAGAFVLAGICDWPAYVMVPILTVHFLATRPRAHWPWMFAFAAAACALFAAMYAYIAVATHAPWNWMAPLLSRRSAIFGGMQVTLPQWLRAAVATNREYHRLPVLLAAGLWMALLGWRARRSSPAATIAWLLLAWAVVYAAIGGKALFNHEWAWMPFTPGLAIAAALLLEWMLVRGQALGVGRFVASSVAILLVVYAAWTASSTWTTLHSADDLRPFTPTEMGEAIRAAAPHSGDVALLVGGEEAEAQLWFYGDRALRLRIWSVPDFERRVQDDTVDLVYDFDEQPYEGRATGIVFPKLREREFAALRAYLKQRYPMMALPPALERHFEVYDLRVGSNAKPSPF